MNIKPAIYEKLSVAQKVKTALDAAKRGDLPEVNKLLHLLVSDTESLDLKGSEGVTVNFVSSAICPRCQENHSFNEKIEENGADKIHTA